MVAARAITLCEVGPRDGLQNLGRRFSVAERIALIDRLSRAGLRRIEAVSFVDPRRVPQMADPEAVLAGIGRPAGLEIAGLVLNRRGFERALACGLDELRFVIVASETFSLRNQGAGIAATLDAFAEAAPAVRAAGRRCTGVIAVAFGCPFEGPVAPERVLALVERLCVAGADEIILADTIGAGRPHEVEALVTRTLVAAGGRPVGGHFHNTRNMGFANAHAGLRAGASILDASVGGLGGCPFAPLATGNIATEDLAFMLRDLPGASPIDIADLIETCSWLEDRLGAPVPGQIAKAGLFPEIMEAHDTRWSLQA